MTLALEDLKVKEIKNAISENFETSNIVYRCLVSAALKMHVKIGTFFEAADRIDSLEEKLIEDFTDAIIEHYYHTEVDSIAAKWKQK